MYKNFSIIILFLFFLNSCGYSPIYTKNSDKKFNLEMESFDGDREINTAIKYNLKRYINQNEGIRILIKTNSKYTKSAGTKNLAGDAKNYNLSATVIFKILYGDLEKTYKFSESSTINDIENQLDETIYETNIKKNFASLFTERLIFQLTKLK
tara:strand:- start:869 stop:1327 length:459 start_codon:yes stop_codon:yes gene_type:complete